MDKLEGPITCLTFLGFEIDSVAMVVRLPQAKLRELKQEVDSVAAILAKERERSCTKKNFELLVGRLAHTSQVVCPGKTFIRSLFKLQAGQRHCKP